MRRGASLMILGRHPILLTCSKTLPRILNRKTTDICLKRSCSIGSARLLSSCRIGGQVASGMRPKMTARHYDHANWGLNAHDLEAWEYCRKVEEPRLLHQGLGAFLIQFKNTRRLTPEERRERARLRSERWRRAHGIGPRKPAQRPWLAMGISRSTMVPEARESPRASRAGASDGRTRGGAGSAAVAACRPARVA
jgi:hypothetical protein